MALIEKLSAIGDAIREKNGTTDLMTLEQMPQAIADIQSGGGDTELVDKVLTLEGDCSYKFYKGRLDWLIREYGDRMKVGDITALTYCFSESNLEEIPFDLTIANGIKTPTETTINNAFTSCGKLTKAPYIRGNIKSTDGNVKISMMSIFQYCENLTEIPFDFFDELVKGLKKDEYTAHNVSSMFYGCNRLRTHPNLSCLHKSKGGTSTSYNSLFQLCTVLDEIVDLPTFDVVFTANKFSNSFSGCYRIKNLTFATDEGIATVASWKSQTIALTSVGYVVGSFSATDHGIADGKRVHNDTNYQALKNDPDWWTANASYSRYNHDSAVETINSLPDTSAYLAENGGTNTIKFNGSSGSLTDGGAINTLTEEEIAVATAKGWTVTLS